MGGRSTDSASGTTGKSEQGLAEHTEILNALKEREVHKAEQAMCRHIRGVRQVFEQYFDLLF